MNLHKDAEEMREALLGIAADCVEGIYRAKKAAGYDPACPPRRRRPGQDFLYDWVHLNVGYWTQMARLGSAYSVYAHRFIAALYGAYAAPCDVPCADSDECALSFSGGANDRQTRELYLSSTEDGVKPRFEPIELEGEGERFEAVVDYSRGGKAAEAAEINKGDRVCVRMQLTFPDKPKGRTYRGTLTVKLGSGETKHPVSVRMT